MSNIKIDIGKLRDKHSEETKKLTAFLESKLKMKTNIVNKEITFEPAEEGSVLSKDYLRVILRKFLHKQELKEEFRIIAGKENTLVIKERKLIQAE